MTDERGVSSPNTRVDIREGNALVMRTNVVDRDLEGSSSEIGEPILSGRLSPPHQQSPMQFPRPPAAHSQIIISSANKTTNTNNTEPEYSRHDGIVDGSLSDSLDEDSNGEASHTSPLP